MRFVTSSVQRTFAAFILASLLILGVRPLIFSAGASQIQNRLSTISSSVPSDPARYRVGFDIPSNATLGSITLSFCSNSPLQPDPCTAPTGFDASAATLISQSGITGFTIDPLSTANVIILTRTAQVAAPTTVQYVLNGVVNPDYVGTFFLKIETYATEDASGPSTDFGGVALTTTNQKVQINTTVPPYLYFCMAVTIAGNDCTTASGDYLNFGEFSTGTARTATTQMVVATNAGDGYIITVNGTTMLSGTNAITALTANDVSRPGTSQFGINLRNNSDPDVGSNPSGAGSGSPRPNYNVPDRYRFVSGEQVASSATSDAYRKYTTSYIVNISPAQPPGVYVSTLSYVCTATF